MNRICQCRAERIVAVIGGVATDNGMVKISICKECQEEANNK